MDRDPADSLELPHDQLAVASDMVHEVIGTLAILGRAEFQVAVVAVFYASAHHVSTSCGWRTRRARRPLQE